MKTNSSKRQKPPSKENIFRAKLKTVIINRAARNSGFKSRSDGKITAVNLITGFMKVVAKGLKTYQAWANEMCLSNLKSLTKQAVEGRMNAKTEKMLRDIFLEHFQAQLSEKPHRCEKFRSIYVEDSTSINLPEELAHVYPGNISHGKEKSQAKIHAMYNMSNSTFAFLNLHSFTDNDQSLSSESLQHLQPGELILRDLGFLTLPVLGSYISRGIFFITRKKYGIGVHSESGEKINLKKCLHKRRFFDGEVLVGEEKIKMRMVIIPVDEQTANQRRHKAKTDRDKRCNHSKEYYDLLGYTILLTNITKEESSPDELFSLYGLRWKIEIIFKSWKSCFNLENIIPLKCKNVHRINCIIYLMLLYILLFQTIYCALVKRMDNISILKLASAFTQFLPYAEFIDAKAFERQIIATCYYEKRKTRENAEEKYHKLAA